MNHPTTLVKDKTYVTYFRTYVFASGVAVDADSTPTYVVYKNGSASGDSVTISNIATGLYKLSFNPASEVEGDFFAIDVSATVSAVAYLCAINFIVVPDVVAIQSGLATSAVLTAVANAIGAFTGTGVNTILGFFRAIMRSDASVPSDVGGTFASSTDSLESLGTAIAGLSSSLGSGADLCTLRIRETNLTPVADADVWITTDSAGTNVVAGTKQTDSSGEVTFLLDAGNSYYLWAQKDGWEGIQGTAFTAVAD